MNEHPVACLDRFAVRDAGVVQKARAVATMAAVDYTSIGQIEHERMARLGALAGGGAPSAGQFSLVLDDPLARGDRLYREKSHAMDGRTSCGDASQSDSVASFRCIGRCV